MTNHSLDRSVAAEVRAEMARQQKTQAELAAVIGVTAHTAGRRCSGAVPFDVIEIAAVAEWLSVPVEQLLGNKAVTA